MVQDPGSGVESVSVVGPAFSQQLQHSLTTRPVPRAQGDIGGLARQHPTILSLILGQQPDEGVGPLHGQASAPPNRSLHSATCVSSILVNSTPAAATV